MGPLKYLAETTGKEMNTVVNWFLLMIIFVFDPLAIALVVAANMAFAQIKPKEIVTKELYYHVFDAQYLLCCLNNLIKSSSPR